MLDEELRTRLQALAAAGQQEPEPSALGAIRRRRRRKLRSVLVVAVAGVLVAAGGVRLLPQASPDTGAALAPAGGPATFIGQAQQSGTVRLAVLDTGTGRLRR